LSISFYCGNKWQKSGLLLLQSKNSQKIVPKVNNGSIGENSPNLVTLLWKQASGNVTAHMSSESENLAKNGLS
jgi:hypothetical protein